MIYLVDLQFYPHSTSLGILSDSQMTDQYLTKKEKNMLFRKLNYLEINQNNFTHFPLSWRS